MNLADLFSSGTAVLVTLAILFILVIVHELGHFFAARRFGVLVHEFGIGFPPRARVLATRGETVYTLNWLPIGGFVRLEGEDGGDPNDPRSFAAQSLPRRVAILAAGCLMNLALALVILTGITLVADPSLAVRFGNADPGTLAATLGLSPGDTLEAIDGVRASYFEQEDPLAPLASHAGQAVTLTVRHADGSVADRTVTLQTGGGLRIGLVQDGSPAASAGLRAGDVIEAIDGKPVGFVDRAAASSYLHAHAGQSVRLTVLRTDGSTQDLTVTLRPPEEATPARGALGVGFDFGSVSAVVGPAVPHDPLTALEKGVGRTAQALGLILGALGSLVASIATTPTQAPPVTGPVGIVFVVGNVIQSFPPVFLLWMTGIISANLALLNILPFPPLDGGRIAVALLKSVAGNRISAAAERYAYFIGFALLMGLVVWVTYFDLIRGNRLTP